jgi:hypothetical protein
MKSHFSTRIFSPLFVFPYDSFERVPFFVFFFFTFETFESFRLHFIQYATFISISTFLYFQTD